MSLITGETIHDNRRGICRSNKIEIFHDSPQCVSQAYICLFVCMTIKALNLELVSDLSLETFLMAFCHFIPDEDQLDKCTVIIEKIS